MPKRLVHFTPLQVYVLDKLYHIAECHEKEASRNYVQHPNVGAASLAHRTEGPIYSVPLYFVDTSLKAKLNKVIEAGGVFSPHQILLDSGPKGYDT